MSKRWIVVLTFLCLVGPPLLAQSGESGIGEVAAFGGGTSGIGSHAFAGGSSGIAFSRYALGVLDVSYSRFGHDTLRKYPGQESQNSNLFDFNFSAHIRYPINRKWAPYGIVGPSLLWNRYQAASAGAGGAGVYVSRNDMNFGFHTGGGVRYHINDNWGIRPEVRVVISNQTYVAFSLGVFFNIEGLF